MRTAYRWAGILVVAVSSGCVHWRSMDEPRTENPNAPVFSFVVQSDPPGAEVHQVDERGDRLVGKTPLRLSLKLSRRRHQGALGLLRPAYWRADIPDGAPLVFRALLDETVAVRIPELQLRLSGYQPESFERQWKFPADLKERVSDWKSNPISRNYSETVVFRNPTEPQYTTVVTINSATGKADIHALDAKGGLGRLVGTTPLAARMGFNRVRSASGAVTDWIRWHEKDPDLWSHNREGDLLLNCVLVREGYEPEVLRGHRILNFRTQPAAEVIAHLQLVRPNKPEAVFKLRVDSLPSDASVYAVHGDGSLGQEVGKTPFEVNIGMAQESVLDPSGSYVHKDWRIWAPDGLVRWQSDREGNTLLRLTCAVYKDGFAVESITQPLFLLTPGEPYPEGRTVTFPLLRPEQAAIRDSHRLQQARIAEENDRRRPAVVWQAPPSQPEPPVVADQDEDDEAEPARQGTRLGRWWRGVWRRGK